MTDYQDAPREFEGRISNDKDWREIVAWVGDLPPMPHVASRAISMVEDPDTTSNDLADLLSTDTALAARVLKIANSAMFSRQREITTLNQAIMIIGFKALKGIIVAAALRQINKHLGKMQQLVWENSIGCAMAANIIAKKLKRPYTDEIFLMGLLHSLGQLVLLVQPDTAKDYRKVLNLIRDEGVTYAIAEQVVYGFAHPLIGALVAKKWNFSAETCQIILHYCDPLQLNSIDNELEEKTASIQLAELLTHACGIGSPDGYQVSNEQITALGAALGLNQTTLNADLEQITCQLRERFEQEKHVYG